PARPLPGHAPRQLPLLHREAHPPHAVQRLHAAAGRVAPRPRADRREPRGRPPQRAGRRDERAGLQHPAHPAGPQRHLAAARPAGRGEPDAERLVRRPARAAGAGRGRPHHPEERRLQGRRLGRAEAAM
ncbi:MAG: hypothetical protein AVDCRST_MAG40-3198, partial [uncultured Gemmatimonadaceae bacterium]